MYEEGMRKYKTDGRYPSQYDFHNGAKSRQLARDLYPWWGAPESLHWQFDPAKNWTAPYSDSSLLWYLVSPLISTLSSDTLDLSKLRHVSITFSTLQANIARTDGWFSVINNTTKTTWVKGYQLSTIQVQWRPEWRVASYRQYEYNNDLSEGLSVINDTTKTTWMKGCHSSTIRVRKWPI